MHLLAGRNHENNNNCKILFCSLSYMYLVVTDVYVIFM